MALIEIDEGELTAHRRVTEAMNRLLNDPRTRRKVLEAQKTLDPNVSIPELDAHEPIRGELGEVKTALADIAKQFADDRAEREARESRAQLQSRWDAGRGKLRANGYTDEGLAEVEKFMESHGVADHTVAAAAYERLHPPVEPVRSTGGNRFDLFDAETRGGDEMKALFNNPDDAMALDGLINDTLRQVRGR